MAEPTCPYCHGERVKDICPSEVGWKFKVRCSDGSAVWVKPDGQWYVFSPGNESEKLTIPCGLCGVRV